MTDFAAAAAHAFPPTEMKSGDRGAKKSADYQRGDPDKAFADADVRLDLLLALRVRALADNS